jgi:hypothetical protein
MVLLPILLRWNFFKFDLKFSDMKWFITVLFFPLLAVAQQPFGYHATWYFAYDEAGLQGIDSLYYVKDSVYKGDNWQFFKRGAAGFTYMLNTKNDSVFYLLNDEKRLLYDFNASIGDSWQFATWDTSFSCVDTPTATVLNIGYDTINGNALKYWLVEDKMDSIPAYGNQYLCSSGWSLGGKIYQHIGRWQLPLHILEPLTPNINFCDGTSFKTTTVFAYQLRCYKDDNHYYQLTNKGCTWWSGQGFEENQKALLQVYPNPSLGRLTIYADQQISLVEITDLSGRTLAVYENQTSFSLPQANGLYFLTVTFSNGQVVVHKVLKN